MAVELRIPSAGESITEVQIGDWRKQIGEYVNRDEVLVEIETDKASMELPAPVSGVLKSVLKKSGETATVGDVIAAIEESASAPAETKAAKPAAAGDAKSTRPTAPPTAAKAEARVMPAARRALAEAGVSASDVNPTGPGGRLLKEDVQRHVAGQSAPPERDVAPALPQRHDGHGRDDEIVPMTLLRRRIAERLVEAQRTAALLTTFNEIDMSAVGALRKEYGEPFVARYGVKLGFMSFFVKAVIEALKRIPQLNAEIRGTDIAYHNYYDIGVAVGTEHGLVVPILRDAERMSFAETEKTIGELAVRARDKKLTLDELKGGTFTISNGGIYGSLLSTPIVNPPQSGILGLHAVQDRPVARGGQVVIRPMMYVALTYDHRLIDGREAVTFLKTVKDAIETPARILLEV